MRGATLESFLFLFTLRSFVVMGLPAVFPVDLDRENLSDDNSTVEKSNIFVEKISITDAAAPIAPYMCVYIPPELDFCNFFSYRKSKEDFQLERKQSEKKKRKLLNNKKYLPRSSMRVPGTERFPKQKPVKTIIYEIQRCVPTRLPFAVPWCTDEDLADKKSETRRLYPFMIKGSSIATYEFPIYDISRRTQTVSKSV